eukprot:1398111-Lingulodinium_polyedra.AAC.1
MAHRWQSGSATSPARKRRSRGHVAPAATQRRAPRRSCRPALSWRRRAKRRDRMWAPHSRPA